MSYLPRGGGARSVHHCQFSQNRDSWGLASGSAPRRHTRTQPSPSPAPQNFCALDWVAPSAIRAGTCAHAAAANPPPAPQQCWVGPSVIPARSPCEPVTCATEVRWNRPPYPHAVAAPRTRHPRRGRTGSDRPRNRTPPPRTRAAEELGRTAREPARNRCEPAPRTSHPRRGSTEADRQPPRLAQACGRLLLAVRGVVLGAALPVLSKDTAAHVLILLFLLF